MRGGASPTLREATETWLAGARDGSIGARGGRPFKPSTIRSYEEALNGRVLKRFGAVRLSDLGSGDLQRFVDELRGEGLDPSTIRNAVTPLRVIYRWASTRGLGVGLNPTRGLELPSSDARRDRVAAPAEAAALIAAVPEVDRALWATAFYTGLRRGELMALRWEDLDVSAGLLRVERSWDAKAREVVEVKSRAGRRQVPVPRVLRPILLEHRMRQGRGGEGLVFGRSVVVPFEPTTIRNRALKAWEDAELEAIGLHEARHTFASMAIAAGVNPKALSTYMGHASITITLDRYGHLMPGNEEEAAALLDAYLERTVT
jgi:integrase